MNPHSITDFKSTFDSEQNEVRSLKAARDELKQVARKLVRLESENQEKDEDLLRAKREIQSLETDLRVLKSELASRSGRESEDRKQLKEEIEILTEKTYEYQKNYEGISQTARMLLAEVEQLRNHYERETKSLQIEKNRLEERVDSNEKLIADWIDKVREAFLERDRALMDRESAVEETLALKDELQTIRMKYHQARQRLDNALDELDAYKREKFMSGEDLPDISTSYHSISFVPEGRS